MITKKTYERLLNNYLGFDFGTFLKQYTPVLFECMFFDFWLNHRPKQINAKQQNSRPMKRYKDDPRMITTRYDAQCKTCKCNIPKGMNCYYWPRGKHTYCTSCGEAAYKVFLSNAADEEVYHGRGNPYCG